MGNLILRQNGVLKHQNYYTANQLYSIGVAGDAGFGVGVCPDDVLPAGMTPMQGCKELINDNRGNYTFTEGSQFVFIPVFYYRIGSTLSPNYATYGANAVDVVGMNTFRSETEANAQNFAIHRAFIDGGAVKAGFFFMKYMGSKVANGSGWTVGSVKNGLPLSSAAAHNPFSGLTGGANYYYSAVDLPHRIDGTNGNVNASSIFHCGSIFQRAAIALLSMAHAQATHVRGLGTTNCAWYHATYNFPKGLNNNQAPVAGTISSADVNDTSITFTSDGYSNCGKTGSGSPFAKTTHNGQTCGIADVNGLMWEISIGATAIVSTKTVVGATKANPCVVELNNTTDMVDGYVQFDSVGGMTQLNNKIYSCTVTDGTHITLTGIDSSAYGTYTSGGTASYGKWYVAKQATAMKTFTADNTTATGHWGATGVAAMMEEFTPVFETSGGGAFSQRMGSGSNQVLSSSLSGSGWLLAGMGFPKDENGIDTTGTDLFGKDYYSQYLRNEMCLVSSGGWGSTTRAGVWYVNWYYYRTLTSSDVGLRAACYPT